MVEQKRSPRPEEDPRLKFLQEVISFVPSGYYAVREDADSPITFMRLSRPKSTASYTKFAGTTKIQTQHGPHLENALVLWPSGRWSVYNSRAIPAALMLLANFRDAAMLYAQEIGHCMRCNADLTDARSRHYGIGPECEQKPGWEWVIPTVDMQSGD